jgi:hypothetical protein
MKLYESVEADGIYVVRNPSCSEFGGTEPDSGRTDWRASPFQSGEVRPSEGAPVTPAWANAGLQ